MIKKFNIDEFIEELDEFWDDLQNDKLEFSSEELQLAKRIIEQNPKAFSNEEGAPKFKMINLFTLHLK